MSLPTYDRFLAAHVQAKRGVFITSSSYTTQATQFAQSVEGIVLVNGAWLAELMVDHEVGATARTLKVPKFDTYHCQNNSQARSSVPYLIRPQISVIYVDWAVVR
ncbi:MAG: restriction endonuclease [Leptothrix sp. (in: b-proteobacteria)]